MYKRALLWLILSAALVIAGCSSSSQNHTTSGQSAGGKVSVSGGSYTNVNVLELKKMLENKDFTFVNVHIPFEGNIHNTDLSIAYDQIEQNLSKLPADKNAKIVLYCRSGRMSAIAAEKLVEDGYTNVFNLTGGMIAWENAGLPLEDR